jgi:uncharacterized protein YndB with AHSA1/START domain
MTQPASESGADKTSFRAEGKILTVERTFNAPRQVVFGAFTDADRLAQWWGPRGWQTTSYKMEFRPGGQWHYCMRGPDGMESWGLSTYQEIVEPERIVYTDVFSDESGKPTEGMPTMTIVMEFTERDGATTITSRSEFASPADLDAIMGMGMKEGLTETWDRLEEYVTAA